MISGYHCFAGEITLRETFISLYIVLIVSLYNFYENQLRVRELGNQLRQRKDIIRALPVPSHVNQILAFPQ